MEVTNIQPASEDIPPKDGQQLGDWLLGRISPMPSELPGGWKLTRLSDVARLESGHTPSTRHPEYWDGGIPWISLHDSAGLDVPEIQNTVRTISRLGLDHSSARLLPRGTVVFSRTATVGKSTVMGRDMATSQDFANYVCGTRLYNHYLVHVFRFMGPEWERLKAGSTHNSIYMPIFKDLQILLPPHREQEAIAEALSDADALIESLEQLIAKKRQIKQGAMQELLTGKKRLPGFTGDWKEKLLGELFNFSGGYSASRDQLSSDGYCYLHYGDIHTSKKSFVDVRSECPDIPKLDIPLKRISRSSQLDDGDVVFVDASEDDEGTSRHIIIINKDHLPFISGLHTIVAKSKTDELVHEYRRYCFQTKDIKDQFRFYAVGTKVSGISKTNIAKVNLPLPLPDEQAAIATILSDMDAEIAALEEKLARAHMIKQGMMQELLPGRIRLPLPSAKSDSALPKQQPAEKHSAHFNEAVVLAIVVHCFGSEEHPLGRFRRTKFSYLLHRHLEHEAPGFLKKAAGPYNPTVRYGGAERIALNRGYVLERKSEKANGFVAGDKITQAKGYFEKWYGAEALRWLDQFRFVKNDDLELLTTVDMACQDLHRDGKVADLAAVKNVIREDPEWSTKLRKSAFSDEKINAAINKCCEIFDEN